MAELNGQNVEEEICLVRIPVTYHESWQDGFGARGWKLDISIDDPDVIASTAETGSCIPTSVLIHDILDHYLCGLPMSGHRNEAVALIQLQARTGSDPYNDFAQMVDEDLMRGCVSGEPLLDFLPEALRNQLRNESLADELIMRELKQRLGDMTVREALIKQFFDIGCAGSRQARETYENHGLNFDDRKLLGTCLQGLLVQCDQYVKEKKIKVVRGSVGISTVACSFDLDSEPRMRFSASL